MLAENNQRFLLFDKRFKNFAQWRFWVYS